MHARTTLQRSVRPAVLSASAFVVGLLLMGWLRVDASADLPSYGGGYAWVRERTTESFLRGVDELSACEDYVRSGASRRDGYSSDSDFLKGCRAAYRKK